MRRSSDWKANAVTLLVALALASLYGWTTALALWMLDCPEAVEIGGIVSTVTGILALIVAFAVILYIIPSRPSRRPINRSEIWFLYFAASLFYVLIIPLFVLTLGRVWRWLTGKTKKEQREP